MKRLGKTLQAMVVTAAVTGALLAGGGQATAAPSGPGVEPGPDGQMPTSSDMQKVVDALVADGATLAQAQADAEKPEIRDWIDVSSSDELIVEPAGSSPQMAPSEPQMAIGSGCTGYSRSGWAKRYFYTWWGHTLGYAKLNYTWCYNYKRVTWETHSKRVWLSTDAQVSGWSFNSWTDSEEYFYTYNGRTNGGVKIADEAYFRFCTPIRVVCSNSAYVRPRAYLHYDGTVS